METKLRLRLRMHWLQDGKEHIDELDGTFTSKDLMQYYKDYKRPDNEMTHMEFVEPDDTAVRVPAGPSDSPFGPLMARRRLDIDEDVR